MPELIAPLPGWMLAVGVLCWLIVMVAESSGRDP
jgi:hypothetical protein